MMNQYKIWFTIRASHGFFSSGGGPLIFEPTRRTSTLIQRLGMIIRKEKNAVSVAFPANRAEDYLDYIGNDNNENQLVFTLVNDRDERFYNYTDIDYPGGETLLSFSQERTSSQAPTEWQMQFGDGFIPYQPFLMLSEGDTVNAPDGSVLPAKGILDLTYEPEGEYTITDSAGQQRRVAYFEKGMASLPVGLITLQMSHPHLASGLEKLVNENEHQPVEYHISFEARKTYWRYILGYQNEERDLSKYRVEGGETPYEKLDYEDAVIYESTEPIALSESYKTANSLRNGQMGKAIIEKLPGADSRIIFADHRHLNTNYYSEIYVYI